MQMVAASKMRNAQQHALAGRPYAELMNRVLVSLQKRTDPTLHPLLQVRELKKELVFIISTDKGLAGALNTNLFREAANFDPAKTAFIVTGKKARQFIARTKRELLADFELKDAPSFVETKAISKFCIEKFLTREVDKVTVLYTHFINTINQKPVAQTLLPISKFDLPKGESTESGATDVDPMLGYIFEPNAQEVLDFMLPYYLAVSGLPDDPRCACFRAQRANGRDEERDRQREPVHQGSDPRIQQDAPGQHHDRIARDLDRADGARRLVKIYEQRKYRSSDRSRGGRGVSGSKRTSENL